MKDGALFPTETYLVKQVQLPYRPQDCDDEDLDDFLVPEVATSVVLERVSDEEEAARRSQNGRRALAKNQRVLLEALLAGEGCPLTKAQWLRVSRLAESSHRKARGALEQLGYVGSRKETDGDEVYWVTPAGYKALGRAGVPEEADGAEADLDDDL